MSDMCVDNRLFLLFEQYMDNKDIILIVFMIGFTIMLFIVLADYFLRGCPTKDEIQKYTFKKYTDNFEGCVDDQIE